MAEMDPRPSLESLIAQARDRVAALYKERMPLEHQLRKAAEGLLPHSHEGMAGFKQADEALNHRKFNVRDLMLDDIRPDAQGFVPDHVGLRAPWLNEAVRKEGVIERYVGSGPVQPLRHALAALEKPQLALRRERDVLQGLCKRAGIDFVAFDREIHRTVHHRSLGAVIETLPEVPPIARALKPTPKPVPAPVEKPVMKSVHGAAPKPAHVFRQASITGQERVAREAAGLAAHVPYYIDDVLQQQYHATLMGKAALAETLEARTATLMREGEPMFDFMRHTSPKALGLGARLRQWGDQLVGHASSFAHFSSPFAPLALHAPRGGAVAEPAQLSLPFGAAPAVQTLAEAAPPRSAFAGRHIAALRGSTMLANTVAPQVPASFIHLTPPEGFVADGRIVDPFPEMQAAKDARRAAVNTAREARLARGDASGFAALSKAEAAAKAAPVAAEPIAASVVEDVAQTVANKERSGIAARASQFFQRFKRMPHEPIVVNAVESNRSSTLLGATIIGSAVAALVFGASREAPRDGAARAR